MRPSNWRLYADCTEKMPLLVHFQVKCLHHLESARASLTVSALLVQTANSSGKETRKDLSNSQASCQKLVVAPSPSEIETEASNSCRTWSSIGKGRPHQGLEGSIQYCQSQRTRSAEPWNWRLETPSPPRCLGEETRVQLTKHLLPVPSSLQAHKKVLRWYTNHTPAFHHYDWLDYCHGFTQDPHTGGQSFCNLSFFSRVLLRSRPGLSDLGFLTADFRVAGSFLPREAVIICLISSTSSWSQVVVNSSKSSGISYYIFLKSTSSLTQVFLGAGSL
jgi:hypothetical protein